MRYSEAHKKAIVAKAMDSNGKSQDEVARESGVHPATLGRWIQQLRSGTLEVDGSDGIQPSRRNPGEKLALLLESRSLGPDALGEWLRIHGLHAEHLKLWEQELSTMATTAANQKEKNMAAMRKENRQLKKELARKEKALAEAAILLTLKKNYPTLFADSVDD